LGYAFSAFSRLRVSAVNAVKTLPKRGGHQPPPSQSILLQSSLIGLLVGMRTAVKRTKTFSLDQEILAEVKRTKGTLSESERVNSLLRFALNLERRVALDREIAKFFEDAPSARDERHAFESAAIASWTRD
jgi:Arc/MetJ family transcription regulator